MKRTLSLIAFAAVLVASCTKNIGPSSESQPANVVIDPVITRALNLNFKTGNQIGLDIKKSDGTFHAQNALLSYDGTAFTGNLKWYVQGGEACSLLAYYPYSQTGFPESFSVASDQSEGTDASDFMVAMADNVYPTSAAVTMNFKHKFAQITVNVENKAGASLEYVELKNIIRDAVITNDPEAGIVAAVNPESEPSTIKAEPIEAGKKYCAIVVPQTFETLEVSVSVKDGSTLASGIKGAELKPGYSYTISVEVLADQVKVSVGGEIDNWEDGGDLGGDGDTIAQVQFEEKLSDGYFTYDNVRYNVVKLADGNWWMAQNLAYIPAGITPSDDLNNVAAGVYYPVVRGASAAEFSKSGDVIKAQGYLYQTEFALGLKVNDLKSVAEAEALEGVQGICPNGWHIPTAADYIDLIGKGLSPLVTNTAAPYYLNGNGSIQKLNEAGFNIYAFGAVSITDNTKKVATLMGYMAAYDHLTSGYICGSTYQGVTYNTAGDETSGIKNLQFAGLMPMTNKAAEAECTCNESKLSYKVAASVRCVRDIVN